VVVLRAYRELRTQGIDEESALRAALRCVCFLCGIPNVEPTTLPPWRRHGFSANKRANKNFVL
jgi:hypothetical protein